MINGAPSNSASALIASRKRVGPLRNTFDANLDKCSGSRWIKRVVEITRICNE